MTWLKPVILEGTHCTLEPLSEIHTEDLIEAVQDGQLWNLWYTVIPQPEKIKSEIERRLQLQAQGTMLPFAVIDSVSKKAVGMTTYLNVDSINLRVEIGATWYRKSVQRTGLNTCAKQLLLTHAFETLGCIAVELRTHFFNNQSRKGIERLGAKLDGILRNHTIMPDNTVRDTCVYSIIQNEWPAVKANLNWLARNR